VTTLRAWLDARDPAPPPALAARAREVLAERDGLDLAPAAEPLLAAAESLLARMLRDGCDTRGSALDLLVADALVTWAFEAATDGDETLVALSNDAMARIASLATVTAGEAA
jgi:hypothetical protein